MIIVCFTLTRAAASDPPTLLCLLSPSAEPRYLGVGKQDPLSADPGGWPRPEDILDPRAERRRADTGERTAVLVLREASCMEQKTEKKVFTKTRALKFSQRTLCSTKSDRESAT